VEIATFYIGPKWLGIDASQVVEAIRYEKITEIPGAPKIVRGKIVYNNEVIPIIELYSEMDLPYPKNEAQLQIILVKYADAGDMERTVGICVDALGEIPEICYSRVDSSHTVLDGKGYTESIIKPEPGSNKSDLLVVLSPEGLMRHLSSRIVAEGKVA
jgi:chemotaxis signal transduction protein